MEKTCVYIDFADNLFYKIYLLHIPRIGDTLNMVRMGSADEDVNRLLGIRHIVVDVVWHLMKSGHSDDGAAYVRLKVEPVQ